MSRDCGAASSISRVQACDSGQLLGQLFEWDGLLAEDAEETHHRLVGDVELAAELRVDVALVLCAQLVGARAHERLDLLGCVTDGDGAIADVAASRHAMLGGYPIGRRCNESREREACCEQKCAGGHAYLLGLAASAAVPGSGAMVVILLLVMLPPAATPPLVAVT